MFMAGRNISVTDEALGTVRVMKTIGMMGEVVGKAARVQAAYHGRQPGDPRRGAAAILKLVSMENPPLRLPLGSDAVTAIALSDQKRLDELERWRPLSIASDFTA